LAGTLAHPERTVVDSVTVGTLAPYLLAAFGLLIFASVRSWRLCDRKLDTFVTLLLIVTLAAVAGSFDLGTDAPEYRSFYDILPSLPERYGWWEPGFEAAAFAFAKAGAPYGLFVFACVLLSHLLKLYVLDHYVSNRLLAFFVLFCFNLGEVAFVRQYLAASILLVAFLQMTRHRIGWAFVLILIATLVHKTALIAGVIIVFAYYGRAALKPLALLTVALLAIAVALPTSITEAIASRIVEQVAVYTVEGYVQGLQSQDISVPRNMAKFGVYLLLALWMALVPARTETELAQRRAATVAVALSFTGFCLVVAVSTVFSRMSTFIFPFLAVSLRTERFAPRYSQVLTQFTVVLMLLANLYVSTYPLVEYL
jgi:hypothetical protein